MQIMAIGNDVEYYLPSFNMSPCLTGYAPLVYSSRSGLMNSVDFEYPVLKCPKLQWHIHNGKEQAFKHATHFMEIQQVEKLRQQITDLKKKDPLVCTQYWTSEGGPLLLVWIGLREDLYPTFSNSLIAVMQNQLLGYLFHFDFEFADNPSAYLPTASKFLEGSLHIHGRLSVRIAQRHKLPSYS